jgi:hypothetical protein
METQCANLNIQQHAKILMIQPKVFATGEICFPRCARAKLKLRFLESSFLTPVQAVL